MMALQDGQDFSQQKGSRSGKAPTTIVIEAREGHITKAQGLQIPDSQVRGHKIRAVLLMLFPSYGRAVARLLGRAATASAAGKATTGTVLVHHEASNQDWVLDMRAAPDPENNSQEPRLSIKIRPLEPEASADLLISTSHWLMQKYGDGLGLRFWHSDRNHRFTVVTDAPGDGNLFPDPSSMVGRTRWECAGILDPSSDPQWQHHLSELERGGAISDFVYTAKDASDQETVWSVGGKATRSRSGEIEGYQGYALDVSDLWHTRRALNRSEASIFALVEQLPIVAAVWSQDWRLLRVSQRTTEVTELPSEVLIGLDRQEAGALIGISASQPGSTQQGRLSGDGLLLEYRNKNGDTELWRQTVIGHTAQGERICVYVDVTAHRQRLASAKRRERLEQFGRFASSLAHDLSNLVAVVSGGVRTIRAGGEEAEEAMDDIETMLETSREMIQSLRSVSAGADPDRSVDLNLHAELEQIVRAFNRSEAPPVTLLTAGVTAQAHVDPISFNRAMLNLLVNAREACGDQGLIAVALAQAEEPGTSIAITVEDNGPGWATDLEQMLGDPLVSTKGSARGFGLAQVTEFVQAFGGTVTFGRSRWGGAKVSVNLPGVVGASPAERVPTDHKTLAQPTAAQSSGHATKLRVLVVDDHQAVRRMVTRSFDSLGWETLQAEDGRDALSILATNPGSLPDLILTDVVMPGMTGTELAATLADQYPGLPVALMSGHVPGGNLAGLPFLQKPFEPENIAMLLSAVELRDPGAAPGEGQP